MNENEFELIDHLYFVTSFEDLQTLSGLSKSVLVKTLADVIGKKWVKCYTDPDNEVEITEGELNTNYNKYQYLATKQGLLAHNAR